MLWVPAVKELVLHVAFFVFAAPAGSATPPQPPMVVPPSVNATVPVGADPVTVAVKVTPTPTSEGFAELASVVVVLDFPPMATVTERTPLAPGVALFTVMVTPVALSTYDGAVASSAASSKPLPEPGVMSRISVSSFPDAVSNVKLGADTRTCAPRLGRLD